jgi:hypothetical protein
MDRVERLLNRLDYFAGQAIMDAGGFTLAADPDPDGVPSPWRSARVAWAAATGTHHLVIQDDAIPCANFLDRVAQVIDEKPGDPIALFFGVHSFPLDLVAYESALRSCDAFYPIPYAAPWIPHVAVVMPRDHAHDLAAWGAARPHPMADDRILGEWAHAQDVQVYATCPSLVDHDDEAPSLMGGSALQVRRAFCFADRYVRD